MNPSQILTVVYPSTNFRVLLQNTVWCKILIGENVDEFNKFPAIREYFSYQNFLFSYLLTTAELVVIRLHPK